MIMYNFNFIFFNFMISKSQLFYSRNTFSISCTYSKPREESNALPFILISSGSQRGKLFAVWRCLKFQIRTDSRRKFLETAANSRTFASGLNNFFSLLLLEF